MADQAPYTDVPLTAPQAKALGYEDIPTSWTTKFPKTAAVARAVTGSLPAIGGIVGGAISTPETLGVGTIPGMALGAGVGRGAQDLIEEATGLQPKTSATSKGVRIGLDSAVAATAAGALKVGQSVIEAAVANPTRTIGEFLHNVLSPLKTARGVAKEMMKHEPNSGAILTRPAWQTWSGRPTDLPKISAGDFMKIRDLVQQGVSESDALRIVHAAKAGATRVP